SSGAMRISLSLASLLLVLVIATAVVHAQEDSTRLVRKRRRLDQLARVLSAATGQSYASYVGYGNYCGKEGSGQPVDKIDACCLQHDHCYDRLNAKDKRNQCGFLFGTYITAYSYQNADNGLILCVDNGKTAKSKCKRELCRCDLEFVRCLQPVQHLYNTANLKRQKAQRVMAGIVEKTGRLFRNAKDTILSWIG
ncbi:hypothetical protein BOX15_Mlig018473g2, partial [Macrostomum lignano]